MKHSLAIFFLSLSAGTAPAMDSSNDTAVPVYQGLKQRVSQVHDESTISDLKIRAAQQALHEGGALPVEHSRTKIIAALHRADALLDHGTKTNQLYNCENRKTRYNLVTLIARQLLQLKIPGIALDGKKLDPQLTVLDPWRTEPHCWNLATPFDDGMDDVVPVSRGNLPVKRSLKRQFDSPIEFQKKK